MKYLVILGLGVSALAVPFSFAGDEDLVLAIRDLPDTQIRSLNRVRSKQSHAPFNSQHPPLLSRSPSNNNFPKYLQKRADTPRTRRTSSQKQLGRATSTVRFPSPDKLASNPSQPTPKRTTLKHSTSLKSQSSLVSFYESPSRESSPWRRHRDSLAWDNPPNSPDRARSSRSPNRSFNRQTSSRGTSPWSTGGGAVHGHGYSSEHSILGFDPRDPHPPLRVPSHASLSEKADASPRSPVTPFGRAPEQRSTPLTPTTPLSRPNKGPQEDERMER